MKRIVVNFIKYSSLFLMSAFICSPLILLLTGSIMSKYELGQMLAPVLAETKGMIFWKWMPDYPTGEHFMNLLFLSPEFLTVYWNSMKIAGAILIGQLFISVPAAWAFSAYEFKFRRILWNLYIILMLLPFQVTMLSQYIAIDRLHMMDTQAAVIVPAIFSTFPVFLIYRSFRSIPVELMEASRIDGAGDFMIFIRIGLPLGSSGILSAMVLGFLECWNLIEQPVVFLKNKALWPLSLYLPEINMEQAGMAFAASVLTLIPSLFVFLLGQDYLEQGISTIGLQK